VYNKHNTVVVLFIWYRRY